MLKQRYINLDIIKIIACFLVIVNHTNSSVFLSRSPSPTWFLSVVIFFISKPAVDLFIMVSGALLLGKGESISKNMNRVLRIALVLFVFSAFYFFFVYPESLNFSWDHIQSFFSTLMKNSVTKAFWYLYLYLGLLIMLPLLSKFLLNLGNREYIYLFFLTIGIGGALPLISHYYRFISLSAYIFDPFFSVYIGLFFVGYYMQLYVVPKRSHAIIATILFTILLFVQVFATYAEYVNNNESFLFFDNSKYITITMSAICIFYVVTYLANSIRLPEKGVLIVRNISGYTFGIYLLSDWAISKLYFILTFLNSTLHPLIAVFLYEVIVFFVCMIAAYILKKIPIIKKYI